MAESPQPQESAELNRQHTNGVSTTMEDINMTDEVALQEAAEQQDPTQSIPPVLAPPTVSPIQSPATPNIDIASHVNNDTEHAGTTIDEELDRAYPRTSPSAQTMEAQQTEQAHPQDQVQIESLRDGPAAGNSANLVSEAAPAHLQGTTTSTSSRTLAASQPLETVPAQMANNEQGSAARVYINTKITPVLLEGMKWVAKNEPEKPLKWLSEYLARRSADIEGT